MEEGVDILLVQETKLNTHTDFKMLNHKVYHADRITHRGGGMVISTNRAIPLQGLQFHKDLVPEGMPGSVVTTYGKHWLSQLTTLVPTR